MTMAEDDNKYGLSESEAKEAQEAHDRSAENHSVVDPVSRDLWQSGNVGTDDRGPTVDQVSPIFAQARADALRDGEVVSEDNPDADSVDDLDGDEAERVKSAADEAQEEADRIRDGGGYAAKTGPEADQYDDENAKGQVPDENLSLRPDTDEDKGERSAADAKRDERAAASGGASGTTYHDGTDQRAPKKAPAKQRAKKDDEDTDKGVVVKKPVAEQGDKDAHGAE
jgi:hypothetical protein